MPAAAKYVLIAAPHTSNWDFLWAMSMAIVLRVRLSWFGKHTLFKPVLGGLLQRWGGVPIRRHQRANQVEVIAEQLRRASVALSARSRKHFKRSTKVEHFYGVEDQYRNRTPGSRIALLLRSKFCHHRNLARR